MNSSLTLYLAILGGVVLAVFLIHSTWQSRKLAARQPRRAAVEPVDTQAGLPGEPTLGDDLPTQPLDLPAAPGTVPPLKRGHVHLDALVDAIATITIDAPMSGDHILLHVPTTRRAGSKPVLIEALRADCGEWEAPQAGVTYAELQAGVLLANRTGGLNEIEYSEFVQKIQAMADALSGAVEFPDMLDVVARAKELDAFAGAHDAQLAMRLYARGSAWSVGYVQQQAARHGFLPGSLPGRLVLPGNEEGAPPVLTLQFDAQVAFAEDPDQAALRELLLAFDVPQTAPEQTPFRAWCAAGEALSMALDAVMADDQGQPFSPAAFASIEGELTRLYEALAARDLGAGSAAARRLFS
ncbi:cell division protein FtsZ [Aquabacterium olei]|uniref:Cell division protein FtsZ n=1 Tax=Aquabacterium olei TaxID=1296669 RepID=A0A2U8FRK8_9BURK|nr:cell division protein FtsZ [Aquabacterium olei]AWI53659.1 cell division protein FtsZ [Aquabacterium olei]